MMTVLVSTPYPEGVDKIPGVYVSDLNNLTTEKLKELHAYYHFDLVVEVDTGKVYEQSKSNIIQANELGIKTAFYCWDGVFRDRPYFEYSELFDYVFTTDSFIVNEFRAKHNLWLPMACPDKMISGKPLDEKVIPLLFFGSIFRDRIELLDKMSVVLKDKFMILGHEGYSPDSFRKYRVLTEIAKNVYNYGIDNHLSIRPFEGLGCGCGVITNELPDIALIPGLEQMVVQHSPGADSAIIQSLKCLNNTPATQEDINKRKKFITDNHTTSLRIKQLIRMVEHGQYWIDTIGS